MGSTPLCKLYRYVPPHRVGFLRRFGLKTGIHFAYFGLESSMVFERELRIISTHLSFQFQMNKKEREICEFEVGLNSFFCLRSNLILSKGQVWKRVWKITFFGPKSGQDLKFRAAHPTKNSQENPLRVFQLLQHVKRELLSLVYDNYMDKKQFPNASIY